MYDKLQSNVAGTSFMAFHFMLDSLSRMNDKDKQEVCGNFENNHENKSVEQKHSKREHHILFWIKMTTHL